LVLLLLSWFTTAATITITTIVTELITAAAVAVRRSRLVASWRHPLEVVVVVVAF
jgi:hypothetical protein